MWLTVFVAGGIAMYALLILLYSRRRDLQKEPFMEVTKSRVAIASVMHHPPDLPIWLRHHRSMGVKRFYIRLEDSPSQLEYIKGYSDVWFEQGEKDKSGENNYFTLMDRQKKFVDACISHATQDGSIDFLFHIDSDELLFGSLSCLDDLPLEIKCVNIENAEALYSGEEDGCFSSKRFRKCSLHSKCRSYINGKAGARPDDKVTQAGPHNFAYDGAIVGDHQKNLKFEELAVLHFDSCSFASWSSKFANLKRDPGIPFSYYDESISAASKAYDVWKKHTMILEDDKDIVMLEHFDEKGDLEENASGGGDMDKLAKWLSKLQAICINLDKNKSKWLDVKNSFMKTDMADDSIHFWRFKAVVGKQLDVDTVGLLSEPAREKLRIMEHKGYRTHHHDLTRGGIGCFLSHWLVYDDLIQDKSNDVYLIIEDDAQLNKNIMKELKKLMVPDDWDIILLGTARVNASSVSTDLLKVYGFWGLQGYLINRKGAEKCVKSFKEEPIDAQIDSRISWLTRKSRDEEDRINIYATKKELVTINEKYRQVTDIQWPIKETPDSYYYRNTKLL